MRFKVKNNLFLKLNFHRCLLNLNITCQTSFVYRGKYHSRLHTEAKSEG